ncbi:MAG: hypothetical protein ACXWQR_06635 [Ktedonobacterales bacterium]
MRFVVPQFALEGRFKRFPVPIGGAHGRVIECRVEFPEPPPGPQEREGQRLDGQRRGRHHERRM